MSSTGCTILRMECLICQTAAIQESIDRINNKIDNNQEDIWQWEEFGIEDAEILVVACGCVSRSAIEAVNICRAKGIKIGMFRPITIWPFLSAPLEKALKNVKTVIVPEMNKGQYVHKIKELVSKGHQCSAVECL